MALLLVVFVVLALVFAVRNPMFNRPEESQHFTVVRDIAAGQLSPTVTQFVGIGEEQQPRLYYLVLSPLVGWADGSLASWLPAPPNTPKGPGLALLLARLTSILMGAGALLCTYLLVVEVLGNRSLALAVTAFQAFVPGFVLTSSTVNNDSATNLFAALALWLGVRVVCRDEVGWPVWLFYALSTAAATWSKLTGLFVLVFFAGTLLVVARRQRSPKARLALASVPAAALGIIAILMLHDPNSRLLLNIQGLWSGNSVFSVGNALWAIARFRPDEVLMMGRHLTQSAMDTGGWRSFEPIDDYLYVAAGTLVTLAGAGLIRYMADRRGWRQLGMPPRQALLLLFLAQAIVLFELFLVQWGKPGAAHYWGFSHARYLFPVAGISSLLIIGGLAALAPRFWRLPLAATVVSGLLILSVSNIVHSPLDTDASRPLFKQFVTDQAAPVTVSGPRVEAAFSSGMTLVSWTAVPDSATAGRTVRVQIVWRADDRIEKNYRAYVHLVSDRGDAIAKSDLVPADDRFPPRLWRRGDLILDDRRLSLPDDAVPGRYEVQVGVYSFDRDDRVVPSPFWKQGAASPTLKLALGYLQVAQPPLPIEEIPVRQDANFGAQMRMLGTDPLPTGALAGARLPVTLYWQTDHHLDRDYVVSVQLLNSEGRLVAQHDGQPQNDAYPTSIWQVAEIVRDVHTVSLPSDLPAGTYRVFVAAYSLPGPRRLTLVADSPQPTDALQIGTIRVDASVDPTPPVQQ